MRFNLFFVLSLMLILVSGYAKADNAKPILSSYTCSHESVPCPEDGTMSSDQWAQYGNACVTTAYGYNSPNGFIDPTQGLDNNNCLMSIPGTMPKGMGNQLSLRCCVVHLQASLCAIRCDVTP